MEDATAIEKAEVVAAEAHDMVSIFEFGQADRFARQRFADEGAFASPSDFACRANPAHLMVGVIPGILDALRHGARRRPIEIGWRPLAQRLVRTLLVVMAAESVKARLLVAGVSGRRLGGLRLERAVHALMSPVLLRRSGPDEMRRDAKLEPPNRKPAQPARPARAKRRAVVATDRLRQAIGVKARRKPSFAPATVGATMRVSIRKRVWLSLIVNGSTRC